MIQTSQDGSGGRRWNLTYLLVGPLLGLFLAPHPTDAFLFRRVSADIGTSPDITHMPLLAASQSLLGTGGGESTIDDGALVADLGPSGSISDIYDVSSADLITTYTVKAGDTVASVASMFDVTPNTIRWANDIKQGESLHSGDSLLILPVTGVKYVVKSGDTLASIAKKFGLDTSDDISSFNDLGISDALVAGSTIIIPGAEIAAQAPVPTKKPSSSGSSSSSNVTGSKSGGYYIKPVLCPFTQRKHDKYAVDLGCPIGTPVQASASGTVLVAKYGWNGAFGNLIVLKHPNGTQTFYAHLSKINVSVGDTVKQGQVIGLVGNTGRSTGPHLHFEVRGAYNPGFDVSGKLWKAR